MDRLEDIFTSFANDQEESLKDIGMTKEEFIENAKKWSETKEGKLEIQKFILNQEIKDLKNQITELESDIAKKQESIKDIDEEICNL